MSLTSLVKVELLHVSMKWFCLCFGEGGSACSARPASAEETPRSLACEMSLSGSQIGIELLGAIKTSGFYLWDMTNLKTENTTVHHYLGKSIKMYVTDSNTLCADTEVRFSTIQFRLSGTPRQDIASEWMSVKTFLFKNSRGAVCCPAPGTGTGQIPGSAAGELETVPTLAWLEQGLRVLGADMGSWVLDTVWGIPGEAGQGELGWWGSSGPWYYVSGNHFWQPYIFAKEHFITTLDTQGV